jgi:hypothetical protein
MEYFNPDYKKFYNCNFSQLYHSSIPSLTSRPLDEDVFASISEKVADLSINSAHKNFIMADLKKSFFKDLKNADVDYLIIDLYADAIKNLVNFPDGSLLSTFHLNLSEIRPELKYDLISPRDNDDKYFEIFKDGVDKFYLEIQKIIPQEKIILDKGKFPYKWQNEKGQIQYYEKSQINIHKDINYFWDKLNNYFLSKFPNIRVIDLRDTDYMPHQDFPFGASSMHYESGYYREFLNRLNKIVLEDKLEELKLNEETYSKNEREKKELENNLKETNNLMAERLAVSGYLMYKIRNLIDRLKKRLNFD